jgi:hypothetical protein
MKKIKYQGGLTKLIASKIGEKNRGEFAKHIELELPSILKGMGKKDILIEIASFSSSRDFYEQVLSILSFLRYVGVPICWTVYSDGSHNDRQINLLTSNFAFVRVVKEDWVNTEKRKSLLKPELLAYKDHLLEYARNKPLGRKVFYYLNHPIKHPTLFLDSDVLFYTKASALQLILNEEAKGWYLPDAGWGCLDSRYLKNTGEQAYQLNGGVVLVNKEFENIKDGLEFLGSLNFEYEYFTDQNIFHILSRCNSFLPLDPRIFILNSEDQFDFSYVFPRDTMALRHYTGPVRHKMWQKKWKWHLSISN